MTPSRSGSRIPLVLMIDVEPDDAGPAIGVNAPWTGFEAWFERSRSLRDSLERATARPVHFTWFLRMDPQIEVAYGDACWAAERYATQLAELQAAGDELAIHPHAWRWTTPGENRGGGWLHDHADASWVSECIAVSVAAYRSAFGMPCRVHRFGSRYITAGIVRDLGAHGVALDMTVEPGARPLPTLDDSLAHTGSLPDMRHAPRSLYRPSPANPLVAASESEMDPNSPWMLPVTAFDPGPLLSRRRAVARRIRFLGQPRHRPAELWGRLDPVGFWRLIAGSLRAANRPHVALAVRSDSLIRPDLSEAIEAKLAALGGLDLARELTAVTASEAAQQLAA